MSPGWRRRRRCSRRRWRHHSWCVARASPPAELHSHSCENRRCRKGRCSHGCGRRPRCHTAERQQRLPRGRAAHVPPWSLSIAAAARSCSAATTAGGDVAAATAAAANGDPRLAAARLACASGCSHWVAPASWAEAVPCSLSSAGAGHGAALACRQAGAAAAAAAAAASQAAAASCSG